MRRLGAVAVVVLASAILLEALVRVSGIAAHLYTEPAFEASPDGTYWRYRPGFEGWVLGPTEVRIGSLGSRLASRESAAGDLRVAIFGDSIAFGQGVASDATFSAELERRLRRVWGSVQVLNFGVQGHSLEMEVAHLADRLPEVEPRVVVLAFGSDDLNPERTQNYVDRFGYLTKKAFGPPSLIADSLRAGLRHSHLALAAKDAYLRRRHREPAAIRGDVPTDELQRKIGVFRATMRRFAALTRGRARMVMCVDLADAPLARALDEVMSADFPDLPYLRLPPIPEGERDGLRVPRDGHPNARAHALYTELLDAAVRRALVAEATPAVARETR